MEGGNHLFNLLVELTGLDKKVVETELNDLMQELRMDKSTLTTDDMRKLVALYLDRVHGALTEEDESDLIEDTVESIDN